MCRYAFKTYKPHYVCFSCRKQFKRPPLEDVVAQQGRLDVLERLQRSFFDSAARAKAERETGTTLDDLKADHARLVSKCPQCGERMAHLGLDFKPPPSSATKVWRRIETVHRLGHCWCTCGCNGPGFIPNTGPELATYLKDRRGRP